MSVSEVNEFFSTHPLSEKFFDFTESERIGCISVAQRDVEAASAGMNIDNADKIAIFNAAVAEQTIFLLLNPEHLTGIYSGIISPGGGKRISDPVPVLCPRASALVNSLAELDRKEETMPDGDSPDSSSPESGDNSGASDGKTFVNLFLSRG